MEKENLVFQKMYLKCVPRKKTKSWVPRLRILDPHFQMVISSVCKAFIFTSELLTQQIKPSLRV